jgi:hypothetical protein
MLFTGLFFREPFAASSNSSLDATNAIAEALGFPLSTLIIEAEGERRRCEPAPP